MQSTVLAREEFTTNPNDEKTFSTLIDCVRKFLRAHKEIEGIGISLPGLVDPETGNALFIPHFKWRDWPVTDRMKAATGLPVKDDNDANPAAMAELWLGSPDIRKFAQGAQSGSGHRWRADCAGVAVNRGRDQECGCRDSTCRGLPSARIIALR